MVKAAVRSGSELRKRVQAISSAKTGRYACPTCGKKKVKRAGYAQWKCNSCGTHFAGGAYSATTAVGDAAMRVIRDASAKK